MICHFTTELSGGAGLATERLHQALLRLGTNSNLWYRLGDARTANSYCDDASKGYLSRLRATLGASREHRRWAKGGFLTSPYWVARTPIQRFGMLPHVVNLHWVSRWLDLPSFFASLPNGFPVVWSLHDMNPLTGGCHHARDCDRFITHCGHCPQLRRPGPRDVAARWFDVKNRSYEGVNLHIVGNSEWTTAQARRSALMRHAKSFHTIPLGVDIKTFVSVEKSCARQALSLSGKKFVVGFACADLSDSNKGGNLLMESLRGVAQEAEITLLTIGGGKPLQSGERLEVVDLGNISSPRMQSVFYSACDVFVTPSRIESFGLTALESMACGTPVVAFRTGGLTTLVEHLVTGLLVDGVGSVPELREALLWMMCHPLERGMMTMAARRRVESHFTDELMASRYTKLYTSLVKE